MNVTSLELCKELYELIGWDDTYFCWRPSLQPTATDEVVRYIVSHEPRPLTQHSYGHTYEPFPAYDLGYLMRKLQTIGDGFRYAVLTEIGFDPTWHANRTSANTVEQQCEANTPEDAACKLAIELFKQGILTNPTAVAESKKEE